MSNFDVLVREVTVQPHPDADALEIGLVDGYQSVIAKGSMKTGDLAVYIPEAALVPDYLLEDMGLVGKLAGPDKNRVKAIKLRGVVSQGILYKPVWLTRFFQVGDEVGEILGIKKWRAKVPPHMSGDQEACEGIVTYTDIESIQKYPLMFNLFQQVRMTEKLHGSCCIVGLIGGKPVVSSKGIAGRGLVLKENDDNVYWRAAKENRLHLSLMSYLEDTGQSPLDVNIILFGEVLGVQDLTYGYTSGSVGFRAFDLWVNGEYMDPFIFDAICASYCIPTVPILYQGAFTPEIARIYAEGQSTIADHIREGVVIRPIPHEMKAPKHTRGYSRVIGKLVSRDYLTRKGDVTEYE